MINATFRDQVRVCKLKNGELKQFDVCCTEEAGQALSYFNDPSLRFVGSGVYWTLNNVPANDSTFRYFFCRTDGEL
jgi:hypothetical protein